MKMRMIKMRMRVNMKMGVIKMRMKVNMKMGVIKMRMMGQLLPPYQKGMALPSPTT